MKYIPDSQLEAISSWLQGRDGQSGVLFGQILQYSTGINSPPSSPIPTSSFNKPERNIGTISFVIHIRSQSKFK